MRRILALAVCLLIVLGSCTEPRLGFEHFHNRFLLTGVTFSNSTPTGGETVTATINFQGTSGPFTFTVDFGDCVTPGVQTVTAPTGATSMSLTFTLDDFQAADRPQGKECAVVVMGTDAQGVVAGPVMGTIHVAGTGS